MYYSIVERDFVKRTLVLLDQYDQYVVPVIGKDERYEVTLLLNCLLGLIVLPFEHSKREQHSKREHGRVRYPQVVGNDQRLLSELEPTWGLSELQIVKLKIDGETRSVDEINLRELITLVRHSLAHARFEDGSRRKKPRGMSVNYQTYSPNPIESVILQVNLVNRFGDQVDFEASIPVTGLKDFARMVAEGFLTRLEKASAK